jgi:hypothetical protein
MLAFFAGKSEFPVRIVPHPRKKESGEAERPKRSTVKERRGLRCVADSNDQHVHLLTPLERIQYQRRTFAPLLVVVVGGAKRKHAIIRVDPKESRIREGRPSALRNMFSTRPAQ